MLAFSGNAKRYEVKGIENSEVTVYSEYRNRAWRIEDVQIVPDSSGNYTVAVPGWGEDAEYYVVEERAKMTPDIKMGREPVDISTASYNYIIITHPDFVDAIWKAGGRTPKRL